MKKFKNTIFYTIVTSGCISLMYWIMQQGAFFEKKTNTSEIHLQNDPWTDFVSSLKHSLQDPLAILLAQIVTIILVARFFGWLFRKIGQPSVVGEIVAGIALGPSLLGMYFPEFSAVLFPVESLGNLKFLSQIGLILFMFVIGMELDLKVLKNKANDAVVISHASIVIPFTLGTALAYFIYESFAPVGVKFLSFSLFLGISMSITAFPVLARIVQERGLNKTKLGAIVITCAAADDITAWCLLAAVIAIVKAGSFVSAIYVILMAVAYVFLMLFMVRPFLKHIGNLYSSKDSLVKPVVAIFFLVLIISSYATEVIGIHALFGAFMTGAIMPDVAKFRSIFIEKVEDVSVILLLPLFFVFTGLKTEIGLINDPNLQKITIAIIAVAVVGKFFGSAIAAKFVGQSWKDSLTIGALMNTRGLMELIVLNIGLELKVLTPAVFTMMVIMAIVTTMMTGPALDLIEYVNKKFEKLNANIIQSNHKYKVLISFGNNHKGKSLLKLANSLTKKRKDSAQITALHLTLSDEMHSFELEHKEKASFVPILQESKALDQDIETVFKTTLDIETEIAEIANQGGYDLLLIGLGKSIFEGSLLGKFIGFTTRIINPDRLIDKFTGKEGLFENSPFDERTRQIVSKTKMPLGILIDKDLQNPNNVFIPILNEDDVFLFDFAHKLLYNNNANIIILDDNNIVPNNYISESTFAALENEFPNQIQILPDNNVSREFLDTQDLVIISLDSWKELLDKRCPWLSGVPSLLIIKP